MGKKNYSCEESDSCSLVSVTGISAYSSNSSNSSNSSKCFNNDKCEKSSCSNSSSSSCSSSSSSSCIETSCDSSFCSSGKTYSDCSTNKTTDTKSSYSSCSTSGSTYDSCSHSSSSSCPCPIPNKCESIDSKLCEEPCAKKCERLVKKYTCAKDELMAFSDIIVVLNFIKNKLIAVQPNIDLRQVDKYSVEDNINWLECFVDTLFCVLRKNESYKVIRVKDCKLKNDSDLITDNRTYLIKIKYCTKSGDSCRNIPLVFRWSQLTNNDAKSYKAVLNYVIKDIDNYIKGYQAAGTIPFLC